MKYNLKKLRHLIETYLQEAQLSEDEKQIVVLSSILDDIKGFEKELREKFMGIAFPSTDRRAQLIREILGE